MRRLAAWLVILATACSAPDRAAVLQPDWEREGPRDETEVEIPEGFRPFVAEPPDFALPEGDGPVRLSIEQVVMLTLANNRDLKTEQLAPVIAGTFEEIERGVFDPEAFAELVYGEERSRESSRSTGEEFDVESSERDLRAGVRQEFPTGTTVEGAIEQERRSSDRSPDQDVARIGLTVTQQLLRGLGPAVNLVRVRQAELSTTASTYELRRFAEVLLAEAKIAYWNYVRAVREISIVEKSLTISRQQLAEIEERIVVGVLPETVAAVARTEVAVREQALIQATSDLTARRLRLLRLIDADGSGRLDREIRAVSTPDLEPVPIDNLEERISLAVRARPDLSEARVRLEQDRLEIVYTRNGLLPRLEFFASFGETGYGDGLFDSFGSIDGDTWDYTVGLTLSAHLGNRTAKARDLAARANHFQGVRAVENLEQMVRLDVRLAANEVERARLQISASRTTRILQEKTVAAERERLAVGASTPLLVAQAQRDLLATQIAEVAAVITYRIALIRLYLAEGSLLDRSGVEMDGGIPEGPAPRSGE